MAEPIPPTEADEDWVVTILDPNGVDGEVPDDIAITNGTGVAGLLPAGFLSTSGNQIVDATGASVRIMAINWFGLETDQFAPQGLWAQTYRTMMSQMADLGFNTIRLPFSLALFEPASVPGGIDYAKNPDLVGLTGLQIMDAIVAYAGQLGLKVILDNHRSAAGGGSNPNGLWYDGGYTEAQWIASWQALAVRYAGNATVIGADLANEPHDGATWGDGGATDWQAAATRAGNAIQAVNDDWLMVVEGVQAYANADTWFGGNLMGVAAHPVTLTVPGKVVYSPHDYPANLDDVWTLYWGNIYRAGLAPVLVGELGSRLQTASDQAWLEALVAYMNAPGGVGGAQGISWACWNWSPTSWDTGGVLNEDWTTVDPVRMAVIRAAMVVGTVAPPDPVVTPDPIPAPDPLPVVPMRFIDASVEAEAGRLYQAAFDRAPDAPGLAHWAGARHGGMALVDVAGLFVASAEFQGLYGSADSEAFVTGLYRNVLHRIPDAVGLSYWQDTLNGGATRAQVLAGFSESPENKAATPPSANAQVAARLYWAALGRSPDAEGLAFWTSRLSDGAMTLAQEADALAGSAEFVDRCGSLDDGAFVGQLYRNVLGRDAEPVGLARWTEALVGGASRGSVVTGFSEGGEMKARFDMVAGPGGIVVA